jgi:hypothetical protein
MPSEMTPFLSAKWLKFKVINSHVRCSENKMNALRIRDAKHLVDSVAANTRSQNSP